MVQATKDMETVLDVNMNQIMDDASSSSSQTPTLPSTYPLFSKQFLHHHGRDLFSCAATWFLLDVVFYSNNLFQSNIYKSFLPSDKEKMSAFRDAYTVVRLQAIITVCAAIPGYWATVLLIDRVGRRNIQMMGFTVMAAFLFALGVLHNAHPGDKNMGFMFLYGLTFFFSNFGPNTTTFIVPAELFPARFRATCHGISGASGKVGAIIGSIAFLWASQDKDKSDRTVDKGIGMTRSLVILGIISLVGAVITFLFTPETMGRSLEDNEIDNNANLNNEANGLVGLKCLSC